MIRKPAQKALIATSALLVSAALAGCKPENLFIEVGNGSGGTLRNIKVALPGDEYSIDSLPNSSINGSYHHFSGPGDLTVTFTTEGGYTHTSSGPHVTGNESGRLRIFIDGGYAEFASQFDQPQK